MVEEPARKAEWEERAAADKARFEKELAAAYETELAVVLRDGIAEEVMLSAGDALSSVARRQELVLPLARVRICILPSFLVCDYVSVSLYLARLLLPVCIF